MTSVFAELVSEFPRLIEGSGHGKQILNEELQWYTPPLALENEHRSSRLEL